MQQKRKRTGSRSTEAQKGHTKVSVTEAYVGQCQHDVLELSATLCDVPCLLISVLLAVVALISEVFAKYSTNTMIGQEELQLGNIFCQPA